MTARSSFLWMVGLSGGAFLSCAALVFWVDPYFHYRAPKARFAYFLDNQRCQNDGVVRHFEYEALITGSSMTENFKASDVERLWGLRTVKVPFSGASFRETSRLVQTAGAANANLQLAIVGVDYNKLLVDWTYMREDLGAFPDYLYDDSMLNDLPYLLSWDAFSKAFRGLLSGGGGGGMIDFDEYSAWHSDETKYGDAAGIKMPTADDLSVQYPQVQFFADDAKCVAENVKRNFVPMAKAVRELVLFITPYSRMRLESWRRQGRLERQVAAAKAFAEAVLRIPNVRLFRFDDRLDLIGNPDNYTDPDHYGPWVNRQMLEWIRAGEGEVLRSRKEQEDQ